MNTPKLNRRISLPVLLFYGLGTMVGGGFYALSGKVAGEAGMAAPLAFLLAGLLAIINVFTFSELSSRYPVSAGEAYYVKAAFGRNWFAGLVGWLVIATGVVSAATLAVATIGFLQDLVPVSEPVGIILLVLVMGAICAWGIGQSVLVVLIITAIEVGALLYILLVTGENLQEIPAMLADADSIFSGGFPLFGILSGAFLGFYAFIGFEDMVNMAEEVREPRQNLPRAMLGAVMLTTLLYVVVISAVVVTVPPGELAAARTPFARVVADAGAYSTLFMVIVSILTGINGALVQIIMASRVLYGLGGRGKALQIFSRINARTRTPIMATLFATGSVLMLALYFPLIRLAEATSFIILLIFTILNIALIKIKMSEREVPTNSVSYPIALPMLAFLACMSILIFKIWVSL